MSKIKQKVKKIIDKLTKKSFWIPKSQAQLIEQESKNFKNESELMRHIISNWFAK